MKPKKRQKMCHNCEGEIDIDVIVCPFCAADLREEKPERMHPPYNSQVRTLGKESAPFAQPPVGPAITESPAFASSFQEEAPPAAAEREEEKTKNIFLPVVLFTLGVQLCLFGCLMFLFSQKGVVILKWDAHFWFLYVFFSVPFLVVGYKSIAKL